MLNQESTVLDLTTSAPQLLALSTGWQSALTPTLQKSMADSTVSLLDSIRISPFPAADPENPPDIFGTLGESILTALWTGGDLVARIDAGRIYAVDISLESGMEFSCRFGAPPQSMEDLAGSFLEGSTGALSEAPDCSIVASQEGMVISSHDFDALGTARDNRNVAQSMEDATSIINQALSEIVLPDEPGYPVDTDPVGDADDDFATLDDLGPEAIEDSPDLDSDSIPDEEDEDVTLSSGTTTGIPGVSGGTDALGGMGRALTGMAIGAAISAGRQAISSVSNKKEDNPPAPPPPPPSPTLSHVQPPQLALPVTEWYYLQGEKQVGPLPAPKLIEQLKDGTLSHATMVWTEGMDVWKTAGDTPLKKHLPKAATSESNACPSCHVSVSAGAKFCTACGAKISLPSACPGCGSAIAPGQKFCQSCGHKL